MTDHNGNGKTVTFDVLVRVTVNPAEMRPYPTIAQLPELHRAIVLTEEKLTNDIRWMDGFVSLDWVRTKIAAPDWKLESAFGQHPPNRLLLDTAHGEQESHASTAPTTRPRSHQESTRRKKSRSTTTTRKKNTR